MRRSFFGGNDDRQQLIRWLVVILLLMGGGIIWTFKPLTTNRPRQEPVKSTLPSQPEQKTHQKLMPGPRYSKDQHDRMYSKIFTTLADVDKVVQQEESSISSQGSFITDESTRPNIFEPTGIKQHEGKPVTTHQHHIRHQNNKSQLELNQKK